MVVSRQPSGQAANMVTGYTGQQLHVSGVFIVLLEVALVLENLLPILVVVVWMPAPARGVGDRLVAAFSVTCILSALVPTPLGLASYFSGGWYGGAPTCTTYQVTSIWCNLSSLALLTYMCINCHFAVWRLRKITRLPQCMSCHRSALSSLTFRHHNDFSCASSVLPTSSLQSSQFSTSRQNNLSPRHFNSSGSSRTLNIHDTTSNFNKHDVKKHAILSSNTQSFNIDNISMKGEHRVVVSDNDVEDLINPQNNTLFIETELASNGAQIKQTFENNAMASPCRIHNIKRLGNEQYVHLEEDFTQYNSLIGAASHVDHLSSSDRNTNFGSCHSACLQKTFQPLEESSATSALNGNGSVSEYNGLPSDLANSRNGPVSKSNTAIGDPECKHNCGKATNNEDRNGISATCCFCTGAGQSRDYVSLMLFLLFGCTLAISSLPVIGFGPRSTHSEKLCRSWLVPIPVSGKERTFFVSFLLFVYICLALGCSSGISVCLQVSNRMKHERKRKSRLYHEEENVPDIAELFVLDDMKRQYSLTCVVMAGLLTWLPIAVMLTLQKAGVQVSEATLMYSNIATSLPGLLNPLLYSLGLAKYRAGYKAIMEKCCSKNRKHKNHRLMGVHGQENMADDEASTDTGLDTSATGHTCIHGRANLNYDNLTNVSAEEYDDENDDDGFPDDSELLEDERKKQTPKLNERTPLQAILVSQQSVGAFRTVLANRAKSPWQRQQDAFSSSNDNECLLVSGSDFVDEETGL